MSMLATLKEFASDESGATAIEYGLIAALVAVVAILGLESLGTAVNGVFTTAGNAIG